MMPPATPAARHGGRFAVVFKTYTWDAFVERQARRCMSAAGSGDFYVSIDETNGSVGPVPFERVVRTDTAAIVAAGFANRFEKGSLLWWNADYAHYQFQAAHPDYDFYVFVEYDAVVRADIGGIVAHMAANAVDLVHFPVGLGMRDWFWTLYHGHTYPARQMQGSLICVTAFSHRALTLLARRRLEMSQDPAVPYWPIGEVFVPTEIARAGYRAMSIAEFGSVDNYQWFPPMLEGDLASVQGAAIVHPVLDETRFLPSILRSTGRFRSFLNPRSRTWRALRRCSYREYGPRLPAAAARRLRLSLLEKVQRRLMLRQVPAGDRDFYARTCPAATMPR